MIRLIKSLLRGLLRLLYRVEVKGLEHYAIAGDRVMIVANHTSLLDGILLYAWLPETPTFAINTQIAQKKQFRFFLKFVDLFVMDPANPLSIKSMIKYLKQDRKAVIFPEGRITVTGSLMKIYEGPALLADKTDAMILPIAIDGPQFSPFSYMKGNGTIRWFPKITLTVLPPEKLSVDSDLQGQQRRHAVTLQLQDIMYKLIYSSFDFRTTVFSAILRSARRYGKRREMVTDVNDLSLSYQDIIRRSIILGNKISESTQQNEHVGVLLPNVSNTAVVFMALQYCGRVPAMLNFSSGIRAMQQACEIAQIKTIYTSRKFIKEAGLESLIAELQEKIKLIHLEDLRDEISAWDKAKGFLQSFRAEHHHRKLNDDLDPDKPAVVLFTSGSEGAPKGVVLSRSNLLSNYAQVSCHIDFQPSDLLFSCLPLFHSFGLNAGLLMPLLGGSRIFLYPTPLHYRLIPELIYERGATILFGTNTFFKGYAKHAHPYDFYNLRYVVAGAEKLKEDTFNLWQNKFGIRIFQGYGVTEASPVISVNTPMMHKKNTVGRLMTDMECVIEPVEGIERGGRLIVKGPNVMLGYLLRDGDGLKPPECKTGPGWYDTGDIADQDEDGFISILGRAKRFAKIGGEMVSLAAVEDLALKTWPESAHAAVNLADEKKGEKIILVTENPDASRKEIQRKARELNIGELFIPRQVISVDSIPVLGTGKTDYQTLKKAVSENNNDSDNPDGVIDKLTKLMKN